MSGGKLIRDQKPLKWYTFIVSFTSNGAEALKSAIRDGPDIVFIDVELRGISGLDLAVELKKQQNKICVVLMSEKECFARNGFDIGVDDYVLKPLRKERILKALKRSG